MVQEFIRISSGNKRFKTATCSKGAFCCCCSFVCLACLFEFLADLSQNSGNSPFHVPSALVLMSDN